MAPFSKLKFRNLRFSDLAISHSIMSKIIEKFRVDGTLSHVKLRLGTERKNSSDTDV